MVATDPDWRTPLPLKRPGSSTTVVPLCYGEYFSSIRHFLIADKGQGLIRALSRRLNRVIVWTDINDIHICIQKHGAFYHPARVDVFMGDMSTAFVVNVAISPEGQSGLSQEFNLLRQLSETFTRRYVPMVYHQGIGGTGENAHQLPMFLGEWLSGYHEFHIESSENKSQFIQVWDSEKNKLLSSGQKTLLYRRASEILTYYYNPETFEQIFPWHHGAGDFVVCLKDDDLDLRLVTVRGYTLLVEADATDPIAILEAMLRFFLHLSLRMRIDRVGGTGDLVWVDEAAVEGTVSGFFDSLAQKNRIPALTAPLAGLMEYYFSQLSQSDLIEALEGILKAYPPQSPDRQLMAFHLESHAKALFSCLDQIRS